MLTYNWSKLKTEYIVGDIQDTAEFVRQRIGKETAKNSWIAKKTKGWKKEREAYQVLLRKKVIEANMEKAISEYCIDIESLNQFHSELIGILSNKITQHKQGLNDLRICDIERMWKIIKIEKGEVIHAEEVHHAHQDRSTEMSESEWVDILKEYIRRKRVTMSDADFSIMRNDIIQILK